MAKQLSNINNLLKNLQEKHASATDDDTPKDEKQGAAPDEEMGSKDTTHPSADVDNSTEKGDLEGARSAENTSDNKKEQPTGVEDAGSPEAKPPGGSQGVEDKEPEEGAAMDTGDTSGVSEMLEQDTSHPSKAAGELAAELDEAIKNAEDDEVQDPPPASPEGEGDDKPKEGEAKPDESKDDKPKEGEAKPDDEDEDAKLAAHVDMVVEKWPADFEYGVRLGASAHEQIKMAAAIGVAAEENAKILKKANAEGKFEKKALGEMAPALMGDEAAAGAGEGDVIDALAGALAAEGVSPEELAAIIDAAGAGGDLGAAGAEGAPADAAVPPVAGEDPLAGTSDDEQVAALEAALGETGAAPEDLAQAAADEDETVQEVTASVGGVKITDMKPGSEKFAALITEHPERATALAKLKDSFVSDIRQTLETK